MNGLIILVVSLLMGGAAAQATPVETASEPGWTWAQVGDLRNKVITIRLLPGTEECEFQMTNEEQEGYVKWTNLSGKVVKIAVDHKNVMSLETQLSPNESLLLNPPDSEADAIDDNDEIGVQCGVSSESD